MHISDVISSFQDVEEYEQLPVRHNEDAINTYVKTIQIYNLSSVAICNWQVLNIFCSDLSKSVPLDVDPYTYDSPHTKTFLLFQAHFSRLMLPCSDYHTDTKSVLDQAVRILQVTFGNTAAAVGVVKRELLL